MELLIYSGLEQFFVNPKNNNEKKPNKKNEKNENKSKIWCGDNTFIMLTLISFLLLAKSTHICSLLPTIPHPYNSHFYKLRTFVVLELFFIYDTPTLKKHYAT
jgi:hypothetical protein